MKAKSANLDADDINLIKLAQEYSDEEKARALFESWRWPNGKPICPHCKFDEAYKLTSRTDSKHQLRPGVYCCSACRKTFTATVGTVLEDSHVPISKWLMALFILCSSKKAVSAHQLHRMLGVTYKTAWFMAHRIRHSLGNDKRMLSGTVEVDETFIGGKSPRKAKGMYYNKTPLVALIQRDGAMQTKVVASVTQKNLGKCLHECVDKSAIVNTDEHAAYPKPLREWKEHHRVNHGKYEYCRTNADGSKAHINTCESFFSLMKRGVHGAWHCVSPEHLPKYANEFAFRWNHRKMTDGARMKAAIPFMEGARLMYRKPAN